MDSKELLQMQIESIIIVNFMIDFNKFERLIKSIFQENIQAVEHQHKSILYFYYGCTVGNNTFINYEDRRIEFNNRTYDDEELFKSLTLHKIIRFLRKEQIIPLFNISINSRTTPLVEYEFYDCCEKLIQMRNSLAHDITEAKFNNNPDKYLIELLPDKILENIQYDWFQSVSINMIPYRAKAICSNMVYMDLFKKELLCRNKKE